MAATGSGRAAALVFAGGDPPLHGLTARLPAAALVIAADQGLEHAHALGRRVDVAVGDFDSVDPTALAEAERLGCVVERHDPDKDATDLELALDAAQRRGADRITVVGGAGGRFDHLLGNVLVLASPRYAATRLDAWIGTAHVQVTRDRAVVDGPPGRLVTLLPVHGAAHGVTTRGLRFPLDAATLPEGSTWGVSNELSDPPAEVSLTAGALLVVVPHALDDA